MKYIRGFTLVELLVVISILSVLVSVVVVSFRSSQLKGRDAQRKSDLKQIANALELYYSDYGKYPDEVSGRIIGCAGAACTWGVSEFTDGRTTYFKVLPKDPVGSQSYTYRIVDPPAAQKFQLFAFIENTEDQSIGVYSPSCGSKTCNYGISSSNTSPSE